MTEKWWNIATLESEKCWSRRKNIGVRDTEESEKWWNIATLESEKEHWSRRNGGTEQRWSRRRNIGVGEMVEHNHDGSCSKSGGLSQSHLLNIRS